MRFRVKETRLGLRTSHTRIPFRYGSACLTSCPQAVLSVTIECEGRPHHGYSGDCLPPGWFDKTSGKDYAGQIDDMLATIAAAEAAWRVNCSEDREFFPAWLESVQSVQQTTDARGLPKLLAGLGTSLVERAVMDAVCRCVDLSLFDAVHRDVFSIRPGVVHRDLAGQNVADWLPRAPRRSIFVRHTVGLGDPLTAGDVTDADRLDDGFPQTLEEYVRDTGIRYFKLKVSNQLDHDLQRLRTIAAVIERVRHDDYSLTLDGNEQYTSAEEFDALVDAVRGDPNLRTMWRNTLLIEQPLDRRIALDERHTAGIRALSARKPVIIDESDGALDAYSRAIELGYTGVSSKNCKGPVKSLLNLGLTRQANQRDERHRYLMSGEDLCTVGVIPVQSDLCLVAMLGLEHVERNGHHFHPGLTYLPSNEQQAALAAHGDFYERRAGRVAPRLVDGKFEIGSLQCAGFGFAVTPDMDSMASPNEWDFASLGLDE